MPRTSDPTATAIRNSSAVPWGAANMRTRGTILRASAALTPASSVRVTRRAAAMASDTRRRSLDMSTTPAACEASPLPEMPMAMPTSAAASAGPSLIPSPIIPTTPRRRSSRIASSLVAGFMPDLAALMPTAARTACALASQSPVSMIGSTPNAPSAATATAASVRTASESSHAATTSLPTNTHSTEDPARLHASGVASSRPRQAPPRQEVEAVGARPANGRRAVAQLSAASSTSPAAAASAAASASAAATASSSLAAASSLARLVARCMRAGICSSTASCAAADASKASRRARRRRTRQGQACSSSATTRRASASEPTCTRKPSTMPVTPSPSRSLNPSTLHRSNSRPCPSACSRKAEAIGWEERDSSAAARRSTVCNASSPVSPSTIWWSRKQPSVSVPVLSSASVRILASSSICLPLLTSTPHRAMPETPHACVIGMATMSEQGHARTVSAMARRSHQSHCAGEAPPPPVSAARAVTPPPPPSSPPPPSLPCHRHQPRGTVARRRATSKTNRVYILAKRSRSSSRDDARCACVTSALSCAATHSAGSRCILTLNTPDWLTVPAVTPSPSRFSTGTDSPVSIDSSTAELPAKTNPSTGTRPPGLTRIASPRMTSPSGLWPPEPSASSTVVGSMPVRLAASAAVRWTHQAWTHSDRQKKKEMAAASHRSCSASAPASAMDMVANMLRPRW
mmetsp:Transcript_32292/g.104310  ORF Transcript_32292/g.104310 Transcript_32292/m.104310 type:complete len:691 (+) Transcript_32292:244-2316(+)